MEIEPADVSNVTNVYPNTLAAAISQGSATLTFDQFLNAFSEYKGLFCKNFNTYPYLTIIDASLLSIILAPAIDSNHSDNSSSPSITSYLAASKHTLIPISFLVPVVSKILAQNQRDNNS